MYVSFGTSISLFCNYLESFFEIFVILWAILLPNKSPVASAVFWIASFTGVFVASAVNFLELTVSFWPYLLLKCVPMFLANTKIHILLHMFYPLVQLNISFLWWHYYLITKIITESILSSIFNGWPFWSGNHTSVTSNSELNVFKKILLEKCLRNCQMAYLEQMYRKLLNLVDNHY